MIKKELKITQLLEGISHPIPQHDQRERMLREIREYRISNPILWDQVVKMFRKL